MTQIQQQINALESRIREWEVAENKASVSQANARRFNEDILKRKAYMSAQDWRVNREAYSEKRAFADDLSWQAMQIRARIIKDWTPYFESAPDMPTAVRFAQIVDKLDPSVGSAIAMRAAQTSTLGVSDFVTLISYFEGKGATGDAIRMAREGWLNLKDRGLKNKLAGLLERAGRTDELAELIEEDLETDPLAALRTRQKIVQQHLKAGQVRKAESFLDSEIAKFPNDKKLLEYRQNFLVNALLGYDRYVSHSVAAYLKTRSDEHIEKELVKRFRTLKDRSRRLQALEMIVRTQGSRATPYLWEALTDGDSSTTSYAVGILGRDDSADPVEKVAQILITEKSRSELDAIMNSIAKTAGVPREGALKSVLRAPLTFVLPMIVGLAVHFFAMVVYVQTLPSGWGFVMLDRSLLRVVPYSDPEGYAVLVMIVLPFLVAYLFNLGVFPIEKRFGVIGFILATLVSGLLAAAVYFALVAALGVGMGHLGSSDYLPADQAVASGLGLWPHIVSAFFVSLGVVWSQLSIRNWFRKRRVIAVLRATMNLTDPLSTRLGCLAIVAVILALLLSLVVIWAYQENHYQAGTAALNAGQWEEARSHLRKADKPSPLNGLPRSRAAHSLLLQSYHSQAEAAINAGQFSEARSALQVLLETDGGSNDSQALLSYVEAREAIAQSHWDVAADAIATIHVENGFYYYRDLPDTLRAIPELREALAARHGELWPPTGQWIGDVSQDDGGGGYHVVLRISDCAVFRYCGSADYSELDCRSSLIFTGHRSEPNLDYWFEEKKEKGPDTCIVGSIRLYLCHVDQWCFTEFAGNITARSTLQRLNSTVR